VEISPPSTVVEVNEGDRLEARLCSANCGLAACTYYRWRNQTKTGDIVSTNRILSLGVVNRTHQGIYICEAHSDGQSSLYGNFSLIVTCEYRILFRSKDASE
jgi:hypothetical protein